MDINLALQYVGGIVVLWLLVKVGRKVFDALAFLFAAQPPKVSVIITSDESADVLENHAKFDPSRLVNETKVVHMWDPSTLDYFGTVPVMSKEDVEATVARARVAQATWKQSSFDKRRLLMRTMQRYIVENQEQCARVAVRDSGKTLLDALIGEVLVTCEKLSWLASSGEKCLEPEYRDTGRMMMMKKVHVEYIPLGVIGAIVPWNYPFHNVFNPVSAALFSGNAIVIKVSEYASWSIGYYKRIIDACLEAVGAPKDLVQFVVGYGATGDALVRSGVDKVIFVGSPFVGSLVAKAASDKLTPVVLELGGKDPFVICDDVDIPSVLQTACRGSWQNMGQNCAGPERFVVYEKVYDEFCAGVANIVKNMKTGSSLGNPHVDCGAITMGPNQCAAYQRMVDEAVSKGAKVLAGGKQMPITTTGGSFYPPTVLADVTTDMAIALDEVFGPIMSIMKVKGNCDVEALRIANACDYKLSSCVFSNDVPRATRLAAQVEAGMSAVNDLEGCTYMSQSLPFGGYKKSGYDRFAGPEGLRGLCLTRSVCEDLIPSVRNSIPPPMHYPSTGVGHKFAGGLIQMFYSTSLSSNLGGIWQLLQYSVITPSIPESTATEKKKN